MSEQKQGSDNTYVLDPESAAEMGRLLLQDQMLARVVGGYLPEQPAENLQKSIRVLDIGCGPGGWAMGVAQAYPHMDVHGIDISKLMITYASTQVIREGFSNVRFHVMNALEKIEFPDNYFHLVNIRLAFSFVPRAKWPDLIQECSRVTAPGGVLRLTEGDYNGSTNSEAFENFNRLCEQVLSIRGHAFSTSGVLYNMIPMLGKLLLDGKYGHIQYYPNVFDFSHGSLLHESQCRNMLVILEGIRNPAIKLGLTTDEKMSILKSRIQDDVGRADFRGMSYLLTAWGTNP